MFQIRLGVCKKIVQYLIVANISNFCCGKYWELKGYIYTFSESAICPM